LSFSCNNAVPDKRCETCDLWTHDSGDVSEVLGEEGYSVCGANHLDDIYKRVISHKDSGCEKWRPEEEEPELTEADIQEMMQEEPEAEEDKPENWEAMLWTSKD